MSIFETDEVWYEAGLAPSKSVRCIAEGCNEVIPKGELRIGIMCEDKNDCHGWYHPECLWESFTLKFFKSNPRIRKIEDIKNHASLSAAIRTKIQDLIDKFDPAEQAEHNHDSGGVVEPEKPPEPPQYAMSGSVIVKLDKDQNIYVSGDVGHIGDKLKNHGAFYKDYKNTGWMFSCIERAGARKFLCMPDELPKVGKPLTLDLAELGRQHVSPALHSYCTCT